MALKLATAEPIAADPLRADLASKIEAAKRLSPRASRNPSTSRQGNAGGERRCHRAGHCRGRSRGGSRKAHCPSGGRHRHL